MKISEIFEGKLSDIKSIETETEATETLKELQHKSKLLKMRLQAAKMTRPIMSNPMNIDRNRLIYTTRKQTLKTIKAFNRDVNTMIILLKKSKNKVLFEKYAKEFEENKIR